MLFNNVYKAMDVEKLLTDFKKGKISYKTALKRLKELPYENLGFARIDNHRRLRRGFPEVVFGRGKTADEIVEIAKKLIARDGTLLVTHADADAYEKENSPHHNRGDCGHAGCA